MRWYPACAKNRVWSHGSFHQSQISPANAPLKSDVIDVRGKSIRPLVVSKNWWLSAIDLQNAPSQYLLKSISTSAVSKMFWTIMCLIWASNRTICWHQKMIYCEILSKRLSHIVRSPLVYNDLLFTKTDKLSDSIADSKRPSAATVETTQLIRIYTRHLQLCKQLISAHPKSVSTIWASTFGTTAISGTKVILRRVINIAKSRKKWKKILAKWLQKAKTY